MPDNDVRPSLLEKYLLAEDFRRHPTQAESQLAGAFIHWRPTLEDDAYLLFSRQEVIAGCIVDFINFQTHVIVEVDGSSHDLKWNYDEYRDFTLRRHGYIVLRFTNNEVTADAERVVRNIEAVCRRRWAAR